MLTYIHFQSFPVKVRNKIVRYAAERKFGMMFDENKNMEKQIKKFIIDQQKKNNLAGNAIVCETTFNLLRLCEISNIEVNAIEYR